MTGHSEPPRAAAHSNPVLVVVDSDHQARLTTAEALARRFEPDYRVVSEDSAAAGLSALHRLATDGEDVALIAVDHRLPGMSGLVFLERASELHRSASRVGRRQLGRLITKPVSSDHQ